MELIQSLHSNLAMVASALKLILEAISIFCVAMGLLTALGTALPHFLRTGRFITDLPSVRLKFGTWLLVALEFQLGADIVATTVDPTLQSLAELAILAAVRTFLNYFLAKELEAEERVLQERLAEEVSDKSVTKKNQCRGVIYQAYRRNELLYNIRPIITRIGL